MRTRLLLGALVAGALTAFAGDALASSHREAPFVTKNPKVDSTDFYMFLSYETGRSALNNEYVTVIANYLPLQDNYGGPNYFALDPEALYEIHVDNNGDGTEDLTFQFEFDNTLAGAGGNAGSGLTLGINLFDQADAASNKTNAVPLLNIGPLDGGAGTAGNLHVNETYTMKLVRGDRRTGTVQPITGTFTKPVDNIGNSTFNPTGGTGGYEAYARSYIKEFDMPGCTPPAGTKPRVFVGQRREGFAANIGVVFDLVGALPAPGLAAAITDGTTAVKRGRNAANPEDTGLLYNKNVTSIAIEVPASCLKAAGGGNIVGGWTSASLRQARVLNPNANYGLPAKEGGAWTQVSRLGSPLVNEVVIGLKDKDKFSSSHPKNDGANFADYVTHPTLPALIQVLYGLEAPKRVRTDLVGVFATGLTVNLAAGGTLDYTKTGNTVAEMLRINLGTQALSTITTAANQNNLGAVGCFTADRKVDPTLGTCDLHGFPNGRRPGDDVVDIALRVVMGALFAKVEDAPARDVALTDLNWNHAEQFDSVFPYLKSPHPGSRDPYTK